MKAWKTYPRLKGSAETSNYRNCPGDTTNLCDLSTFSSQLLKADDLSKGAIKPTQFKIQDYIPQNFRNNPPRHNNVQIFESIIFNKSTTEQNKYKIIVVPNQVDPQN